MSSTPATMTQADFARHRGVDKSYITRLKKSGRLVMTDDGKRVRVAESVAKLADTEDPSKDGVRERFAEHRAERELPLGASGDLSASGAPEERGSADPGSGSMSDARKALIQEQVTTARLKREEMEGRLVDAETVRRAAFEKARVARNALMALVDVIAPRLAAETNAAKVHDILSAEVRRVCEELSAGEAGATRQ